MNQKVKTMVGIGLFSAIVIVLQLLVGQIKLGMFSITLVLVPIVVGSAVYSWKAGAFLGFMFGFAVLLSGDAGAYLAVNPVATVFVVLLKGVGCGLVSGLIYRAFEKTNRYFAVILAAVICPVVNTGIFMLGSYLFFLPTINEWAAAAGFSDSGSYLIIGVAGVNFLVELGVNIVLSPVILRIINLRKK